jgi:hypothetical protein
MSAGPDGLGRIRAVVEAARDEMADCWTIQGVPLNPRTREAVKMLDAQPPTDAEVEALARWLFAAIQREAKVWRTERHIEGSLALYDGADEDVKDIYRRVARALFAALAGKGGQP